MSECVDIKRSWGYDILFDWYITSVDETEEPKWTPEHIEELTNDFYVIPKRKDIAAPIINTPEWISVKDRLPDAEGRYIVYATISTAYNIVYYGCLNWTGNSWDCSFGANITHWMTLPEPPEIVIYDKRYYKGVIDYVKTQ